MAMCEKPGCVAAAVNGGLCAAHGSGGGKLCPRCLGKCKVWRQPYGDGKGFVEGICGTCAGVGLVDQKQRPPREKPDPVDDRPLMQMAKPDDEPVEDWETATRHLKESA